jgi:uncharacterized Fe-S cluster-containing radical SAM superfamily protein
VLHALLRTARRHIKESIYPHVPSAIRARVASYRFGRRYQLPNTIYLETTSACNLNCVMCAAQRPATKRIKPSGYMDLGLFKRLIDEIVRDVPSLVSVYLHKDGEPLIHPDIVEMIDYASSRHGNVTLVTNATLLDDRLSRAILATKLQNIRFSVDGLTQATFEKVRIQLPSNEFAHMAIPVGFDAVMGVIERFLALRAATGNRTLSVGMRTTDFKPTAGEIDSYRAHWMKKVEFVDVAELISWTGEIRKEDEARREPCMSPWSSLVVSWDGALVPCCTYIDGTGHGKGRLFDLASGSLRDALKAERRKALMRAHLDSDLQTEAPYCVPCRDWRGVPIPTQGRAGVLAQLRKVAT